MKYRTYPQTDITVSEVGFGLWTTATGWWGNKTDDEAVALLHEAESLGITLYDPADAYGNGRYAGERKGQQEIPADFSPGFVRFALEQSLRRLRTDYTVQSAHPDLR